MHELLRKQLLLQFLASSLWISGSAGGSDVTQPAVLWKNESEDATIDCSHTKGQLYFQMYWFRQLPGKTMELIVFTTAGSSKHDFGGFSQEKFSAAKAEAESGALTVKSLEPADGGLYFCAVSSAQRCRRPGRLNKNPHSQQQLTVVWTAGGVKAPRAPSTPCTPKNEDLLYSHSDTNDATFLGL